MKGNVQSFAHAMHRHNPPSHQSTRATTEADDSNEADVEAVIRDVMQSGFDYQKLIEIKDALVRQERKITVDAMWDVLQKDYEHHGRTLPVRKRSRNTETKPVDGCNLPAKPTSVRFDEGYELMATSSTEADVGDIAHGNSLSLQMSFPAHDIETVCEFASVDRDTAVRFLQKSQGNPAAAIESCMSEDR